MWAQRAKLDWVQTNAGTYSLLLQPGSYKISLCGAGGAGGGHGYEGGNGVAAGGKGGGGGNGTINTQIINLVAGAQVTITVPPTSAPYVLGGNGGPGGSGGMRNSPGVDGGGGNGAVVHGARAGSGGAGGGGGKPAIVKLNTRQRAYGWGLGLYTFKRDATGAVVYDENGKRLSNWTVSSNKGIDATTGQEDWPTFKRSDGFSYKPESSALRDATLPTTIVLYANGGGGGGGGGGGSSQNRYGSGGGGGGGGGWYYYEESTGQVVSVPGQSGAGGAPASDTMPGGGGNPGKAGRITFANVRSGAGGHGDYQNTGGEGASGGGASGGGGGAGASNESWAQGGGGGGGAGGDSNAHGGTGGLRILQTGDSSNGGAASNPGVAGVLSLDPWGNVAWSGYYGSGGDQNLLGGAGWVRIQQQ